MRIDTRAKDEIKKLVADIGRGDVKVLFGLCDEGVRASFTCPGVKGEQVVFPKETSARNALPDALARAKRCITDIKTRSDRRRQNRIGTLGHKLQEAANAVDAAHEPVVPVRVAPPDQREQPSPTPTEEATPMIAKQLKKSMPPQKVDEPGTRGHLKNGEIVRATQLLDRIGVLDVDKGIYTFDVGYDDESVRALVNADVKIESYVTMRRKYVGKLPTEVRQKKLSSKEQIAKLTQRVTELEAENAKLKAAARARPILNGDRHGATEGYPAPR